MPVPLWAPAPAPVPFQPLILPLPLRQPRFLPVFLSGTCHRLWHCPSPCLPLPSLVLPVRAATLSRAMAAVTYDVPHTGHFTNGNVGASHHQDFEATACLSRDTKPTADVGHFQLSTDFSFGIAFAVQ